MLFTNSSPHARMEVTNDRQMGATVHLKNAEVLMLDFSRDQVVSLLDLLFTGTTEKAPMLGTMLNMLLIQVNVKESNNVHSLVNHDEPLNTEVQEGIDETVVLKSMVVKSEIEGDEEGEIKKI